MNVNQGDQSLHEATLSKQEFSFRIQRLNKQKKALWSALLLKKPRAKLERTYMSYIYRYWNAYYTKQIPGWEQATRAREKRTAPTILKILSSKKGFFFLNKLYNKLITCYVKSIWALSVKPVTTSGAVELCKHQQRSV